VLAAAVAQTPEAYNGASEAERYAELGQTEFVLDKLRIESIKTVLKKINEVCLLSREVKLMKKKILVKSEKMKS